MKRIRKVDAFDVVIVALWIGTLVFLAIALNVHR